MQQSGRILVDVHEDVEDDVHEDVEDSSLEKYLRKWPQYFEAITELKCALGASTDVRCACDVTDKSDTITGQHMFKVEQGSTVKFELLAGAGSGSKVLKMIVETDNAKDFFIVKNESESLVKHLNNFAEGYKKRRGDETGTILQEYVSVFALSGSGFYTYVHKRTLAHVPYNLFYQQQY